VLLQWAGAGAAGEPEITGHSYDLGITSSQQLLSHEVGRQVELVRYGEDGREAAREKGRLLAAENGGAAVVEVGGRLLVNPRGTLIVLADEDAGAVPQLTVQAESPAARAATLDLAYLTRGLGWSADYVASLPADREDRLDLQCYATVTNRTGTAYPGASLSLVAGSPNRAAVPAAKPELAYSLPAGGAAGRPRKQKQDFEDGLTRAFQVPAAAGDLYTYALKSPATVHSEQLNRLLMLERRGLPVKKEYSYRAPYLECYGSPQQDRGAVAVSLAFSNDARAGLGAPLPQGTIRVYEPDRSGRLRYTGAAEIPATPKEHGVHVTLANAFDVTAEYHTLNSRQMGRRKVRKEVEVLLRSERPRAVPVRLVQGFSGGWSMAAASRPFRKLDAGTAQWTLPVPAGGAARLRFTADLSW
jgi:hypothetical protein